MLDTSHLTANDTNANNFSLLVDPNNANQLDVSYSAIPEPSSPGLLALGALALVRPPALARAPVCSARSRWQCNTFNSPVLFYPAATGKQGC